MFLNVKHRVAFLQVVVFILAFAQLAEGFAFSRIRARGNFLDLGTSQHDRSCSRSSSFQCSSGNMNSVEAGVWLDGKSIGSFSGHDTMNNFNSIAEAFGLNISTDGGVTRNIIPQHSTSPSDLFCNRELSMEHMEAIGFDMDWTLAQYNEDFDLLAFNGAIEKLENWLGYPKSIKDFTYSQDMCKRSCILDKQKGNILKIDMHNYVTVAEHGLTELTSEDRKEIYMNKYYEMHAFIGPNFVNIDTPFSLIDASLFVQLVDLKDRLDIEMGDNSPLKSKSYEELWIDLRKCVDSCHKDGVIKKPVEENPEKYITYDPNIFPMLESFRKSGRKTFLLTNSLWDYTQVVMNYLESKKSGSDKNLAWTEYFDVIICGGNKPNFLVDSRLPIFRVLPSDSSSASETMSNVDVLPQSKAEVSAFLNEGKLFQGGNAQILQNLLQITSGDKLLYVGDHVYADVLRSKRTLGWRTCLIIPELTNEIVTHKNQRRPRMKLIDLRRDQFILEQELDDTIEEEMRTILKDRLVSLELRIKDKLQKYSRGYHPKWGALFKAGFQQSRFSKQICDYACIYTSRASNLGLVSPLRPFRPVRDQLPHDIFMDQILKESQDVSDNEED